MVAPVGLCYLDRDLRFVHVNEWLANINGLPVAEHIGLEICAVLPSVATGAEAQLRSVIESGEPILEGRVEAETPAHPGEIRHYLHNYYPDKTEDCENVRRRYSRVRFHYRRYVIIVHFQWQ